MRVIPPHISTPRIPTPPLSFTKYRKVGLTDFHRVYHLSWPYLWSFHQRRRDRVRYSYYPRITEVSGGKWPCNYYLITNILYMYIVVVCPNQSDKRESYRDEARYSTDPNQGLTPKLNVDQVYVDKTFGPNSPSSRTPCERSVATQWLFVPGSVWHVRVNSGDERSVSNYKVTGFI